MHIYSVSVGEPWDFTSPDGPNIIKGSIVNTVDSHCIVFKTLYELEFGGKKGDTFILSPRYGCCCFEDLEKKGEVIVNISLLFSTKIDGKSPKELWNDSVFVMVGGIKK